MSEYNKTGWIKLFRSLRNNPYMRKPAYRAVWIELLLEAEHGMINDHGKWRLKKESELKTILWKGERIKLKPGQLTCGASQLASWTGVPRGSVERVLKCFKSEEQIEVQTSNKYSLITILNWDTYQISEEQNEERMRNKRGTSEEQVRTPKECNNDKNEEEERNLSSDEDGFQEVDAQTSSLSAMLRSQEISSPDEQKNSSKGDRKEMVDAMVLFLKNLLRQKKIADFKNDNKTIRNRTWNIIQMVTRQEDPIPKEELQRRLHVLFAKPCQNLNCWTEKNIHHCNDINKLYAALKGFIEPQAEQQFNQY